MLFVYIGAILAVTLLVAAVYDRTHRGGRVHYDDHVGNPGKDVAVALNPTGPFDVGGGS